MKINPFCYNPLLKVLKPSLDSEAEASSCQTAYDEEACGHDHAQHENK